MYFQLEAVERAPRLVVSGYWKLQRTLCRHASLSANGGVEIKGINLVKFASESSAYQTRVGIRMSRLARSLAAVSIPRAYLRVR